MTSKELRVMHLEYELQRLLNHSYPSKNKSNRIKELNEECHKLWKEISREQRNK